MQHLIGVNLPDGTYLSYTYTQLRAELDNSKFINKVARSIEATEKNHMKNRKPLHSNSGYITSVSKMTTAEFVAAQAAINQKPLHA